MKTACITTTINVPRVLELYRAHGPDVKFFIAGDDKSPHGDSIKFSLHTPNCEYYSPGTQRELGYACSELIGWDCVQRRNIALLEALKWGADLIVSIDDDNIPVDRDYFKLFGHIFGQEPDDDGRWHGTFNGLQAESKTGWVDVGRHLVPPAKHRGFPRQQLADLSFTHVTNAKVAVAAGACLGDPDICAIDRIANAPTVTAVTEMLRAGFVVDGRISEVKRALRLPTWTVFNSQNTAIIRELAPAFFMLPHVGRYDDIFASLICQRIMREHGWYTHFGKPFVWQERNQHNLLKDLKGEMFGMRNIQGFADQLDELVLPPGSVLDQCREIWTDLVKFRRGPDQLPARTIDAAFAFLNDVEKVL